MEEDSMTGSIGTIGISDVVEHDDGSATYTFEMDDVTTQQMQNLGLELVETSSVAADNEVKGGKDDNS